MCTDADFEEHVHGAGILAHWPLVERAHAGIEQQLRQGIAGRAGLFRVVGRGQMADEIRRVITGNELQGVADAGNDVGF